MKNVTVQSIVTPKLKKEAEKILDSLGLNTSEAVRIFLQQVVNSQALPFRPQLKASISKEKIDIVKKPKNSRSRSNNNDANKDNNSKKRDNKGSSRSNSGFTKLFKNLFS